MKHSTLYYVGSNPAVDLIVTKCANDERHILLIRRSTSSSAEGGKWALPGGFVTSDAPKGARWKLGAETEITAAKRELLEESNLDLSMIEDQYFIFLGIYDQKERDPRNSELAWVESHLYKVKIDDHIGDSIIAGDDAEFVKWFALSQVLIMPRQLFAFDHFDMIMEYLK
jgi:ADP-ribose pyrophosphatase YjhB (NUDIX family)